LKVKILSFQGAFNLMFWKPHGMNDKFALISIQESNMDSGVRFTITKNCIDVLTIFFDDVTKEEAEEISKCRCMESYQAEEIIQFAERNKDVDFIAIHCHAGISRSSAVGKFVLEHFGDDSSWIDNTVCGKDEDGNDIYKYLPNKWVYSLLKETWGSK